MLILENIPNAENLMSHGEKKQESRCIVCTSSDAPWKKHKLRFQVEDTIEADGQTFLKLDGDWGRYYEMGGMIKSIKKPDHFMTIEADVHSIPFLNSGLLNLDPEKMWISSDDV
jgi:hypothetical protein